MDILINERGKRDSWDRCPRHRHAIVYRSDDNNLEIIHSIAILCSCRLKQSTLLLQYSAQTHIYCTLISDCATQCLEVVTK